MTEPAAFLPTADPPETPRTPPQGGWGSLLYRGRFNDRLSLAVRAQVIQAFHGSNSLLAVSANILCALIIITFLWRDAEPQWLLIWLLAVTASSILTVMAREAYEADPDRDERPDHWARVFFCIALLTGLTWGLSAVLFFAPISEPGSIVLIIVITGLSAGAMATGSALLMAGLAAALPMLGGLMIRLFSGGDELTLNLGFLIGIYGLGLSAFGISSQQTLLRTIQLGRLNIDLLDRLARSEEYFRGLVENVSDLITVVDLGGRMTFLSPSVERLLGYDVQDLHGQALVSMVHPDDRDALIKDLEGMRAVPRIQLDRAVRLHHRSGDWRHFHLHGRALRPGPEVGAVVLSGQDATEQQRVRVALQEAKDRAVEMGRAKSAFLAIMSHEIRTPMAGIVGLIDLIKETPLKGKQIDYVSALDRASEHLSDLLDDILDFSKIEAQKIDSETIDFNLHTLVSSVVEIFQGRAEAKGLILVTRIAADVASARHGDARHLRQILANLVGNAVKFTDKGVVEVRVETGASPSDDGGAGSVVRLSVRDTGMGIPADKMEEIFEPFARAETSSSRRHGGTGLGLAISRRLAGLIGGHLKVQSEVGVGSTFTLEISLATGTETAGEPQSSPSDDEFSGLRVLVVDDSDLNRLVVGDMVRSLGVSVDVASDGAEGVQAFSLVEPDLVLLDMQMPVLDGFSAARAMREAEALLVDGKRPTAIVALSATALKEDRERALSAGCDAYVTKPLRREALIGILRTYLPGRAASRRSGAPPEMPRTESVADPVAPPVEIESALEPLLPSFVLHLNAEMAGLMQAVENRDISDIQRLAHSAKGNAMLFGFQEIVGALKALELAARAIGDAKIEASAARRLDDCFAVTKAEADRLRTSLEDRIALRSRQDMAKSAKMS